MLLRNFSMCVLGLMLLSCPLLAQTPAKAGPFDGKWDSESLKCTPTASSARISGMTVKNSQVSFTWTVGGVRRTCTADIAADGSFANKSCELPIYGKFSAKKAELNFQSDQRMCNVAYVRS